MPETTTIPETVELPGEILIDVLAALTWRGQWAWDELAGRTTTGLGDDFLEVWWLFWPAFHGVRSLQELADREPDYETEDDPIYQEIESRARARAREWAGQVAERYGVGVFEREEGE